MNTKIEKYVSELFENSPKTKRTQDVKEEMIANLNDKYNDLIADKMSEEEAYKEVISSIGDIDELLNSLKENIVGDVTLQKGQKKKALLISISIALYILAVMSVLLFEILFNEDELGVVAMFAISAVATGIIVYANMASPKVEEEKIMKHFKNDYVKEIVRKTTPTKESNMTLTLIRIFIIVLIIAILVALSFIYNLAFYGFQTLLIILALIVIDQIIVVLYKMFTEGKDK